MASVANLIKYFVNIHAPSREIQYSTGSH